jgi:hypothetical protein
VPPSYRTLTALGITFAIPAIGFGFVDNFLMIIAGDYIDNSIGVVFGISTLAAAGLGNLVSDWGGIGLQGVIEQSMGTRVRAVLVLLCFMWPCQAC